VLQCDGVAWAAVCQQLQQGRRRRLLHEPRRHYEQCRRPRESRLLRRLAVFAARLLRGRVVDRKGFLRLAQTAEQSAEFLGRLQAV